MQNMTQRQFLIILVVVAAVAFFAARLGFASQASSAGAGPSNFSPAFFSQPISKPETLNPVQPGLSNGVRDLNPVPAYQQQQQQRDIDAAKKSACDAQKRAYEAQIQAYDAAKASGKSDPFMFRPSAPIC